MTQLATLPHGYSLKKLTKSDIPAIMGLQDIIIEALPDNEKNFIMAKTADKFEARIQSLGMMQGVFAQGPQGAEMVAYGGVAFPSAKWKVADMVLDAADLPCPWQTLAVVQSCAVHPLHRGRGLHKALIQAKEEICKKMGKTHMMAEVAVDNPASLKGFLAKDYHVMLSGIDPDDGCKLLYVNKTLQEKTVFLDWTESGQLNPHYAFDALTSMLVDGHKGVEIAKKTGGYHLILKAPLFG